MKMNGRIYCVVNTIHGITIGKSVIINSCRQNNPIVGDTKIILFTKDKGKIQIGDNVGISNATLFVYESIKRGNDVFLSDKIIRELDDFDSYFIHGLADLDYGLKASKKGILILSSDDYVGICNINSSKNTWKDLSLTRKERLLKKESIKGAPFKQWFYFLKKNFGTWTATVYSVTPYIRILIKK